MDDVERLLRRSQRKRRPMICKLCGYQLHGPSPPKRPRRKKTDSAAGRSEGLGDASSNHVPAPVQSAKSSPSLFNSGNQFVSPTVSPPLQTAQLPSLWATATVASLTSVQIFSAASSLTLAADPNVRQSQSSPAPSVSTELAAVTGHCSSSDQFIFSNPHTFLCSNSTSSDSSENSQLPLQSSTPFPFSRTTSTVGLGTSTPQSSISLNTTIPASSGLIFAEQSKLPKNSDGWCLATSSGASQGPSPTQFHSSTAKASSAPVVASLTAEREDERFNSAPPSLFPLVNRSSVTTTTSSNGLCTPSCSSLSSTVCNQFSSQSCTFSRASDKSQASASIFCPPMSGSATTGPVFGSPTVTNGSLSSAYTSIQSNTIFEAKKLDNSTSTCSRNFSSSPFSSSVCGSPAVTNSSSSFASASTQSNTIFEAHKLDNSTSSCSQNFNSSPFGSSVFGSPAVTNSSSSSTSASTQSNTIFGAQKLVNSTSSCSQNFSSSPFGSSVFGSPAVTNSSSSSASASIQSNTVLEAQKLDNSTSSCNQNFGSSLSSSSTSGSCTTTPFVLASGIRSFSTLTQGSSTQSFGSPTLDNNCTVSSTFPFRFGNVITTHSNVDTAQPLGIPASASTNCRSPITTCWMWRSNDTHSQGSSTLAPSTRSSPFWPTPSQTESGTGFGSASERSSDLCQSTPTSVFDLAKTTIQSTTVVNDGDPLSPKTLSQSSSWQQHNVSCQRSSTSVSWTRQNTVMSTTPSSPAPAGSSSLMNSRSLFCYNFHA